MTTDEEFMLVNAATHAHKINTSASMRVVNVILKEWGNLTMKTKCRLRREARDEATWNSCDWDKIINKEL